MSDARRQAEKDALFFKRYSGQTVTQAIDDILYSTGWKERPTMKTHQRITIHGSIRDLLLGTITEDFMGPNATIEFEGEFDVKVEDLRKIVRVRFLNGGAQAPNGYCYLDPTGELEIGDIVDVPTQHEAHNVAMVKGFGVGLYAGPVNSKVLGKYELADLA